MARAVGWERRLEERAGGRGWVRGGGTEMSLIFHQSISFKFEIDCTRVEQNRKNPMIQG